MKPEAKATNQNLREAVYRLLEAMNTRDTEQMEREAQTIVLLVGHTKKPSQHG